MDYTHLFPDNREQGETRIRQCQLVMLRMLKILDLLCNKYKIKYFLYGGSLIGAVRHKGFISWDDDLDVGMTRDNYEKFVRYAVPELPDDIFFQSDETDSLYPSCHLIEAKLRDKYSSYKRSEAVKKIIKWQDGLQIDIAVYDQAYLPHNFLIYLLNRTLTFFFRNKGNKKRAQVLKWISKYSPLPLVYSSSFIGARNMIRLGTNYFKENEISHLVKTKFEDIEVFIPQGWHTYLKRRYGNYMEPPASKDQKGHHGVDTPDPFSPCDHWEILYWHDMQNRLDPQKTKEKSSLA